MPLPHPTRTAGWSRARCTGTYGLVTVASGGRDIVVDRGRQGRHGSPLHGRNPSARYSQPVAIS